MNALSYGVAIGKEKAKEEIRIEVSVSEYQSNKKDKFEWLFAKSGTGTVKKYRDDYSL